MNVVPATSRRPHVLHCITRLGLGGAEQVAFDLLRGLRREYDASVFAVAGIEASSLGRDLAREMQEARCAVHLGTTVGLKAGGLLLAGLRAAGVVRALRPDIVHLHTEIPEAAYAVMVQLSLRSAPHAIVRTIHNSVYWHYWPRVGRWCERRMPSSHVACVSEDARAAYTRFRENSRAGPLPIPPTVIYNGVSPAPAVTRSRTPGARLRLLFAGRLEFQKGADLLPEIVALVQLPAGKTCDLVICGSGSCAEALRALTRRTPPGWSVNMNPPMPRLRERLREFDLVLVPSRFEGLGLIAVEAVLAGVPIVATDAPGLRETLPPDYPWRARAGEAPAFAAVLQKALAQIAIRPGLDESTRRFANERFSLHGMLERYRNLYALSLLSHG